MQVPAAISEQRLVSGVDVLEDATHALTFAQIAGGAFDAQFRPNNPSASYGYTHTAYWLRIRLQQPAPLARTLLLEIAYPHLDHVDLYLPNTESPGNFIKKTGGDTLPFEMREIRHRHPVFSIPVSGTEPYVFYVRVASAGSVTFPMTLWSSDAFHESTQIEMLLLGLFYGALLAMVLYNFFLFLAIRDRVYLFYVAFTAAVGGLMFSLNGLGLQYFWTGSTGFANWANPVFTCLALISAILFAREFLSIPRLAPRMSQGLLWLAAATVGAFFLAGIRGYSVAMRTMLFAGLLILGVIVVVAIALWRTGFKPARFFFIAFGVEIVAAALLLLNSVGALPTNFLTFHGLQVGAAIDVILLSIALADRINLLKHEKELAQAEALTNQQLALDISRRHENELEDRVNVRTRELIKLTKALQDEIGEREAIEVQLRENEQQMRHLAHHDALTGLPNRMLLRDRVTMAIAQASRNQRVVGLLMIDLDNFKQINDNWGHGAGDAVLCTVADRIGSSLRVSDTIARIGGDEFVVLLSEIETGDDALAVAEKIIAAMSEPVEFSGQLHYASSSIGISLFPDHGNDLEALLQQADVAVYRAKNAGKNTFRFAMDPV